MKVSEKIATLNHKRYRDYKPETTLKNAKQCIAVYKGDVYKGDVYKQIDIMSYKTEDLDFAQKHLRIISGLYGVLKPLDLIQPYRLEMDINLKTSKANNIYDFWSNKLSNQINKELPNFKEPIIVNLASNEYYNAMNENKIKGNIIKISFKEERNGQFKIIGILAKKARGMMTNFIIKSRITNPEELKKFNTSNYNYNPNLSTSNHYVFTRSE